MGWILLEMIIIIVACCVIFFGELEIGYLYLSIERKKYLKEIHAERISYANEMYVKDIIELRTILRLEPLSIEKILKDLRYPYLSKEEIFKHL